MTRDEAESSVAANLKFTASLTAVFPKGQSIMAVIRRKCIDCCAGDRAEIEHCSIRRCALWPYRMGSNPLTNRRGNFAPVQQGQKTAV